MTALAATGRGGAGQGGAGRALAYGLGSVGTGVFSTVPSVLLLFYCTEVAGVAPAVAGAILFAPKLWSLLWDPLVGAWSDRVRTPWGRRAPFVIAGALGVACAFAALFSAPFGAGPRAAIWIAATYFALTTLYSLYAVPYVAAPAELADEREAGRLISWRMTLVMVGVILGAAGAPLMVETFGGGLGGYRAMGGLIGAICLVLMLVPAGVLRRSTPPPTAVARGSWRALLHAPYLWLAASYVLQMAGVAVVSATMPYLVTRVLGRETGDVGLAMAVVLSSTLLAVPAWSVAARRMGAARALRLSAALYAVAALIPAVVLLGQWGWPPFLGSLALLGVGFAGLQVLPFMLCARVITGAAPSAEGTLTGVWTASEKIGLAAGPALTAAALSLMPAAGGGGLVVFAGVAPAALALVSLLPLAASRISS
ncbi:MAG: MFS transporter [Pseudomonadota bacterium]